MIKKKIRRTGNSFGGPVEESQERPAERLSQGKERLPGSDDGRGKTAQWERSSEGETFTRNAERHIGRHFRYFWKLPPDSSKRCSCPGKLCPGIGYILPYTSKPLPHVRKPLSDDGRIPAGIGMVVPDARKALT